MEGLQSTETWRESGPTGSIVPPNPSSLLKKEPQWTPSILLSQSNGRRYVLIYSTSVSTEEYLTDIKRCEVTLDSVVSRTQTYNCSSPPTALDGHILKLLRFKYEVRQVVY